MVTDSLPAPGLRLLDEAPGVEVELAPALAPKELAERARSAAALIVRGSTKVDARLLNAAVELRIVGRAGIGVDNIDVMAATERGIVVVNAPRGSSVATAEHTIALMLAAVRLIPQACALVRQGRWDRSRFTGRELRGKTLGIIGLGNIGTIVAELAAGLGMTLVAHDPGVDRERAVRLGVELLELDELYARADFVSLHLPLNQATRNLLDKRALARMRRGAWVINCSRGGIVDEEALVEALTTKHLGGAALDVLCTEPPPPDHLLFAFDNVIITPHLGSRTVEAQEKLALEIAEQIVTFLEGGKVSYAINVPPLSGELAG